MDDMLRRLIFWSVVAITILSFNDNLMTVKRDSSNYQVEQREEFMYRQLDDTISKQFKLIEYERENTRGAELFQDEITERRVRNSGARSIYLHRFD
jgi:hypothetical protein